MNEWLLLVVLLTGSRYVQVHSLPTARYETQQQCEEGGAKYKKESKKRATFVCIEVAPLRKGRRK